MYMSITISCDPLFELNITVPGFVDKINWSVTNWETVERKPTQQEYTHLIIAYLGRL